MSAVGQRSKGKGLIKCSYCSRGGSKGWWECKPISALMMCVTIVHYVLTRCRVFPSVFEVPAPSFDSILAGEGLGTVVRF